MNYKHIKLAIQKFKTSKSLLLSLLLIIIGSVVSIQNLAFYLDFDFNMILSLLLVPFVLYVKHKGVNSNRFGFISLFFLIFYPILKIQSLYFFGFAFFILFVIENYLGKLNNLPVFLLVLLSPVAIFAIEVFGFPIRIWLTESATLIISMVNRNIHSSGNQIFVDDNKFTVDPECMGLKMVITGILLILVIISWFEKRNKKEITFIQVCFLLFISFILIIISNLFRITGIIFVKAAPETALHEIIGLFSLILYVLLPMYFIISFFYRNFARQKIEKKPFTRKTYSRLLVVVLIMFLGALNYTRENFRTSPDELNANNIYIEGYKCEILKHNVAQLTNQEALVYIKSIPNFYSADHTPMICWKGSGYQLQNQQKIIVEGKEIYYAELYKENTDILCTAWWYTNGKHLTISQFDWRWRLIKGEDKFSLVNVTCESFEQLNIKVKDLTGLKQVIKTN